MKSILILTAIVLGFFALQAQNFQHDFDKSLTLAESSQKNVLMIFSGSDWCKPCMQLKSSILTNEDFIQFSDRHLVLLELDFPYRKKNRLPPKRQAHNEALADKYNQEGAFPKVLLLSPDQQVIGAVQYEKNLSPEEFIRRIETLCAKS